MHSPETSLQAQRETSSANENITTGISNISRNHSTINPPLNCRVLDNDTLVPWNHPGNLIHWETEGFIYKLSGGFLIPLLFLLGTPANVLNMMVFYRQGLKERINFCLFFLALVDILHLTPVFVFRIEQVYSLFTGNERYGKLYRYIVNNNIVGFYGFGYGSMLLAAIISTERCLCVLFPLTAQRCIPTKAFAVVVSCVVLTVSFLRYVVTAQFQVVCYYEAQTHRTSWQLIVKESYLFQNRALLNILDGVFFGFCLSVGCPALVLVTAIITAVKLRQIIRWRSHSSSGMSSPKEIGVTKMLICLSIEFVLLSIPVILSRVTRLFPSVISPVYHMNLFRLIINCYTLSFYLSSAVNFVVYYLTGTKYRETLHALLGVRKAGQRTVHGKQSPGITDNAKPC